LISIYPEFNNLATGFMDRKNLMTERTNIYSGLGEFIPDKKRIRIAVTAFYFSMGLMFSSWASRIPDIKTALNLNDALFGTILFAMPVAQFIMMTFSGRLVTRFGSRNVLLFALPLYSFFLSNIGLVREGWQLAVALFVFGLAGNLCNISVNTQGVSAEQLYQKPIMASFHGAWSIAGFTGAGIGLAMINLKVVPYWHFVTVILTTWIIILFNHKYLVRGKTTVNPGLPKRRFFSRPDRELVQLGIIAFCSMASEGMMFDWSGLYFKDVVRVPHSLVNLGFTLYMIMMAAGRFLADYVISKIGRRRLLQVCGIMISTGLYTAVFFPFLVTATLAFMLVGLGVSSMIPSVYSAAGRHEKVPPGIALATVASVGFLGFLMGPPMIGYIAQLAGLRYSFAVIGIFGFGITLMVSRIKLLNS
jgi:MFS family permease